MHDELPRRRDSAGGQNRRPPRGLTLLLEQAEALEVQHRGVAVGGADGEVQGAGGGEFERAQLEFLELVPAAGAMG